MGASVGRVVWRVLGEWQTDHAHREGEGRASQMMGSGGGMGGAHMRLTGGPSGSTIKFEAQRPLRGKVKEIYFYLQRKWVSKTVRV